MIVIFSNSETTICKLDETLFAKILTVLKSLSVVFSYAFCTINGTFYPELVKVYSQLFKLSKTRTTMVCFFLSFVYHINFCDIQNQNTLIFCL